MKFHKMLFVYVQEEFWKPKIIIWHPIAEPKMIYMVHHPKFETSYEKKVIIHRTNVFNISVCIISQACNAIVKSIHTNIPHKYLLTSGVELVELLALCRTTQWRIWLKTFSELSIKGDKAHN
jgi:hypothetical protein